MENDNTASPKHETPPWLVDEIRAAAESVAADMRKPGVSRAEKRDRRQLLARVFAWETDGCDRHKGLFLFAQLEDYAHGPLEVRTASLTESLDRRASALWPITIPCYFAPLIGIAADAAEAMVEVRDARVEAVIATMRVDPEGFLYETESVPYESARLVERPVVEKSGRK